MWASALSLRICNPEQTISEGTETRVDEKQQFEGVELATKWFYFIDKGLHHIIAYKKNNKAHHASCCHKTKGMASKEWLVRKGWAAKEDANC